MAKIKDLNSIVKTRLRIIIVILIGIILIISPYAVSYFSDVKEASFIYRSLYFLSQVGKTFFAAGLIALILNVPSLLSDVDNSALRLFKSNDFLSRLSVPELFKLRKEATQQALSHSADNIDLGLEDLDEKFSDLLTSPYYHFYKIRVKNTIEPNGNIKKLVTQEYKIVNPSNKPIDAGAHIEMRSLFKSSSIPEDRLRVLKKIEVLIDDKNTYNSEDFELKWYEKDDAFPIHNKDSRIVYSKSDKKLIFNDTLYVTVKEEREVSAEDNTYIKRLRFPAKSFSVHYFFDSCDVDLIGNGFETFFSVNDKNIKIDPDPNSLNISANNWLLSGNGIMIVHNIKNVSKNSKKT